MIKVSLPQKELDRSYSVVLKAHVLKDVIQFLKKYKHQFQYETIVIVTDHQVKKLVGSSFQKKLSQVFKEKILLISVAPGEKSKSTEGKYYIEKQMLLNHCSRNTIIIALGGGVIGDMGGFVAATYMRGIPYIQMPTTLLSMIDSSVGGKTSINHEYGKNLIGAFHQPKAVFADLTFLETLPQNQFVAGFVEAIKIFLSYDKKYVEHCTKNLSKILERKKTSQALIQKIISRAVQLKAGVVSRDERESGERSVLNVGHTIGHAIEKISNYKILHGNAVALGILIESKLSEFLGFLNSNDRQFIKNLFHDLGFSIKDLQLNSRKIDALINATTSDKKNKRNEVFYVLLKEIGKVVQDKNQFTHPVSNQQIKKVLTFLMSEE